MAEVWLRGNWRLLGLCAAVSFALIVAAALAVYFSFRGDHAFLLLVATLLSAAAGFALVPGVRHARSRLRYEPGALVVQLDSRRAERLPVDVVECFLIGTGPAFLPGRALASSETRTLVVRLRDKAEEWARRDFDPQIGTWCGHQVVIRGTWCEPLTIDLAYRLNARLAEAQKESIGRHSS